VGFYSEEAFKSSLDDTWTTPRAFYRSLTEFNFGLDAAALQSSTLVPDNWYGPDHPEILRRDALVRDWHKDTEKDVWLNPPYGRAMKVWMAKAESESRGGVRVVCLVPARTDTAWWHDHCIKHEVRFIRGRLKFGDGKNSAPFPSALVIMEAK
jgi:phage N-6-adenine-methyltransferase